MAEYALPILALAALILWTAWREYASDNRRDAKLLSAFGFGTLLASGAVWLN